MLKYLVFSTKRSSHHAFIEFFLTGENYIYENDCVLRKNEWRVSNKLKAGTGDEIYLASFERGYNYPEIGKKPEFTDRFGSLSLYRRIIFLRDPINTLASSYSVYLARLGKKNETPLNYVTDNMELYSQLLEYMERSGLSEKAGNNELLVYANRFWSDDGYRSEVEKWLNKSVQISEEVSKFAGGGHTFFHSTRVSADDLMTRFEKYSNDRTFLDLSERYETLIRKAATILSDTRITEAFRSIS